jgi:hypothetical protein
VTEQANPEQSGGVEAFERLETEVSALILRHPAYYGQQAFDAAPLTLGDEAEIGLGALLRWAADEDASKAEIPPPVTLFSGAVTTDPMYESEFAHARIFDELSRLLTQKYNAGQGHGLTGLYKAASDLMPEQDWAFVRTEDGAMWFTSKEVAPFMTRDPGGLYVLRGLQLNLGAGVFANIGCPNLTMLEKPSGISAIQLLHHIEPGDQ